MNNIQALREQRRAKAIALNELAKKDGEWQSQDDDKYQALVKEIEDLDGQIGRIQTALDLEARENQNIEDRAHREGVSTDEATHRNNIEREVALAWMRGGMENLTPEHQEWARNEARRVRNDMGTGTGAAGGFLVPTPMSASILTAMSAFGGMREAATVIQTGSGAAMDFPTTDTRTEEGELVGENQSATTGDPTFGTKSLDTFKFSSKVVTVPFELLQDSAFDLESHIRERLAMRLARVTNRFFTTGTGSGQPGGIMTGAEVGRIGPAGQTTTITTTDLLELIHAVDPVYRSGSRFMFHDQTLKALKQLKDPSTSRPLWLAGYDVSEPDTIGGYAYTINQHVPEMAASTESALFGDFSKYVIRDVMSMLLFRMTDSKFTEKGQVGFLAWMRSGGDLMDVGGAVQAYQNAAS